MGLINLNGLKAQLNGPSSHNGNILAHFGAHVLSDSKILHYSFRDNFRYKRLKLLKLVSKIKYSKFSDDAYYYILYIQIYLHEFQLHIEK